MAVAGIVALWIAFAATHMGLSSLRLRPRLVSALGQRGFLALYSVIALAIFVPMVSLYFGNKHAGAHLWSLGAIPGMRWAVYLGLGTAFVLTLAGLIRPSPAGLLPGPAQVAGVYRITRHPAFMGVGLFGLLHLLVASVNAAELAFFGGLPVFALVGCAHQDRRKLVTAGEDFRSFHAQTSFLPFTGRGTLRGIAEMPVALLLGVVLTVVLRWFHPLWFG